MHNIHICRICRGRQTLVPYRSSSRPETQTERQSSAGPREERRRGGSADLSEQSAVELDDIRAVAAPHHYIQIHEQLLLFLLIHSGANPLQNTRTQISADWCSDVCLTLEGTITALLGELQKNQTDYNQNHFPLSSNLPVVSQRQAICRVFKTRTNKNNTILGECGSVATW